MKIQVARKNHKCDLCEKKIPKGDRYWRHFVHPSDLDDIDRKEHTNCENYANNKD